MLRTAFRPVRRVLGRVRRLFRPLTPAQCEAVQRELRARAAVRSAMADVPRSQVTTPNVYVLTAHHFNHVARPIPLDPRLLYAPKNFHFYFFDPEGPPRGFHRRAHCERDIYPELHEVGRRHLAEWTFFLAEYERPFASYPFVTISSRFYDKNLRLPGPLDTYLPLFGWYLNEYGYGYLPSYDRDFSMIDLEEYERIGYLGTRREGMDLVQRLYGVKMPAEYRYTGDFWCNYIAFQSRVELVRYIEFYMPLLRYFFDERYNLITEYADTFVNRRYVFRNEKPLTLYLEQLSHLFFYLNRLPYIGLHYDGFYEVDERKQEFRKVLSFE
ncbi:MAG: hypothetical protein L0241_27405 [Planctomycetia bacterium]|nr:hypothetical protein [Planctomycetia bacterium]